MPDVNEVIRALAARSKFEVVDQSLSAKQLRIIGRVPADPSGQCIQNWLIIARNLLLAQEAGVPWTVDISKSYFLKGPPDEKKIVYGHRLIIQATDVAAHFQDIIDVIIQSQASSVVQLTSYPLAGVSADRNSPNRGKGASATGGG